MSINWSRYWWELWKCCCSGYLRSIHENWWSKLIKKLIADYCRIQATILPSLFRSLILEEELSSIFFKNFVFSQKFDTKFCRFVAIAKFFFVITVTTASLQFYIRTGVICKKIPCYMHDSAYSWFIVKKAKIFWSYVKHFEFSPLWENVESW